MKKALILILLTALTSSVFAFSVMNRYNGDIIDNFDARTAAMGSAGVAGFNRVNNGLLNPANIALLDSDFGFQATGLFNKNEHNRKIALFNFFDSYTDDATYYSKVNVFDTYAFSGFYNYRKSELNLAAAIFYNPVVNFDSNYEEEVRNNEGSDSNNYPPIIAKNYIEGEGNINSLNITSALNYKLGHNWLEAVAFGASVKILTGEQKVDRSIVWSDWALTQIPSLEDSLHSTDFDYEGFQPQFGLNATLNNRVNLAFQMELKSELEVSGNSDLLTKEDYVLPMKFRTGLQYQPRNIMRTYLNFDMQYNQWSDISDFYSDEISYFFGVEHKYNSNFPIRLGFNYKTAMGDDNIGIPTVSLGTGYTFLEKFDFDISGSISKTTYDTLDLFPDSNYAYSQLWDNYTPQDRGWENPDNVDDINIKIFTSLTYTW